MNKIWASILTFYAYEIWVFAVFAIPDRIMICINLIIASIAVGLWLPKMYFALTKQSKNRLLDEMHAVGMRQDKCMYDLYAINKTLATTIRSLQAEIDRLMFEFCPDEMSPQQIANFENHQRAVSEQMLGAITRTLNGINENEHRKMLQEAEQLVSIDPVADSPEGKRLMFLVNAIESYEKIHYPFKSK